MRIGRHRDAPRINTLARPLQSQLQLLARVDDLADRRHIGSVIVNQARQLHEQQGGGA